MKEKKKFWTTMNTPVGELFIAGRDGKLTDVLFRRPKKGFPGPGWERSDKPFAEVKKQLGEYFRGERTKFELKLAPEGTPFQLAAWRQLRSEVFSSSKRRRKMVRLTPYTISGARTGLRR